MKFQIYVYFTFYGYIPVGLIAQLVEHCAGIAEVMGSNPVQARIFSGFNFTTAKVVWHNCDDQSYLHDHQFSAVQIYDLSYIHLQENILAFFSRVNSIAERSY